MPSTADYRRQARAAEQSLAWRHAAYCWMRAVALYPRPYPQLGSLAQADIDAMMRRLEECRRMDTPPSLSVAPSVEERGR